MRFSFFKMSLLIIFSFFTFSGNSSALTVKEERELGKEVLSQVKRSSALVMDPYISDYVSKLGQKMAKSSDNKLFDFTFMVLRDKSYNAFAVPGGYIFVHTGLIAAMDDESELAGILGHEIAHVNCRHIAQQVEDSKKISAATLAGLAAGIMLGVNGGDPDAVMGVIAGTQAAGKSFMLAYSRNHEREADNRGLKYFAKVGYSPEGLLNILKKIRSREFWTTSEAPIYLRTHPGSEERIEKISSYIEENKDKIVRAKPGPVFSDFNKVRVKIIAFYLDKTISLKQLEELERVGDKKPLAYYGRALLAMKEGEYDKSVNYFSKALKYNALDPELLFDYGRALFLKGEYQETVNKLNAIRGYAGKFNETEVLIGRSYLELRQYDKAREILKYVTDKSPELVYAWYYLGIAYEKSGNKGDAHFALGKYYEMKRARDVAIFHYNKSASLLKGEKKKEALKKLKDLKEGKKKKGKKEEKKPKAEKDKPSA